MKRLSTYVSWLLIGVLALLLSRSDQTPDELTFERERADSPADLSSKGWRAALLHTKAALKDKNMSVVAAGLAYYATLSFFPVALGGAALYASLVSPAALRSAIDGLQGIVPASLYELINTQLNPLASASKGSTIVATVISIALLLWSASGGIQNLIKGTNIAYGVEESRNFIKIRLTSILLSVGLLVLGGVALLLLTLQRHALQQWGFPAWLADAFPYIRWLLLLVLITVLLAFVYRYAPNRQEPRWQWVSWGAVAASVIWLVATILFFVYVQGFSNFNKTYGVFAGLVVLMAWFNVSSLIVLLGAQVNNKLEAVTSAPTQED